MEKIIHLQLLLVGMAAAALVGVVGLLITSFSYKRMLKHESHLTDTKDRWLLLWSKKDRLLQRMNRFVWYPSLACTACFLMELLLRRVLDFPIRIPAEYIAAVVGIPLGLVLLRFCLDISHKEGQALEALAEYVGLPREQEAEATVATSSRRDKQEKRISFRAARAVKASGVGGERQERRIRGDTARNSSGAVQAARQEKILAQIEEGMQQTAAGSGKFKKLLTPEEREIMREIIQEFMETQ